jgi:two-component system phosphate regulon response regulator OmpR
MTQPDPVAIPDDAPHLLVVDDDARIRTLLQRYLGENGYRVTAAKNAADARTKLATLSFDLLVLDVMMPGENGFTLAESIREESDVPILMLTARGASSDRIRGLEIGADDYLQKPFEPRELLLRISAILKRMAHVPAYAPERESVRFGPFTFYLARGELQREGETIRITERERDILRLLSAEPGATVDRLVLAGGSADVANQRTVDVQVNRLRRKIERDPANPVLLQTVRGTGYRLVVEA